MAPLTIDVDMSEALGKLGDILAVITRLETKVDILMTEASNTQDAVQAEADQITALDARLSTATGLLQAFLTANAGGPVNLAPVEQALAHLTGTVGGVETIAAAETPAPPAP